VSQQDRQGIVKKAFKLGPIAIPDLAESIVVNGAYSVDCRPRSSLVRCCWEVTVLSLVHPLLRPETLPYRSHSSKQMVHHSIKVRLPRNVSGNHFIAALNRGYKKG
jgi:hypothetical protein